MHDAFPEPLSPVVVGLRGCGLDFFTGIRERAAGTRGLKKERDILKVLRELQGSYVPRTGDSVLPS